MKGTELSYQEHECRLYNLFDKFAYVQGETLYEYYWRFSQLINDMHTIRMTMQQVQVSTKFLNALPSEWSKFVTDVKLTKSLYTTNYDQLYAYLSQQERHANEVRITRERYSDPLALVANSPNLYNPSRSPQHSERLLIPRNQATIQDGRVTVQQVQGRQSQSFVGTGNRGISTTSRGNYTGGQPRVMKCYNCQGERHMTRQCTQPKKPRNAAWFKEKLMLAEAQEASFQTKDLDAFDSDCDDLSSAKAVPMANLSSYDLDVLSEESQDAENQTNKMVNESLTAELEMYKEQVAIFEQRLNVEHDVISVIDDEETLILEEESRSKMLDKQNDPISIEKKIKISPIDYSKIEAPSELPKVSLVNESLKKLKYQLANFEKVVKKRTTSDAITAGAWDEITNVQTVFNQMEVAVDQCSVDKNAFEIQIKQLSIDNDQLLKQIMSQEIMHIAVNSMDILDVKKSCVNECNKCLELGTELLKKKILIEKDVYDQLLNSYSTLEKRCISLELKTQLNQEVFQKDNFRENQNAPTFNQLFELNELKAQSQEKDTVIRKLKDGIKSLSVKDSVENAKKDIDEIETINIEKLKGKDVVDTAVSKPNATIAPRMFKLDIESISHRLKNNRDAYEVYLEKTIKNTDTLCGLVECAIEQNPSEPLLESACMFTKHVQELLVYVSKTCPSLMKPCEKLVIVTPINKDKGVKPTTSASGSKPLANTKNNRITRPPSSNQKNKVEDHSRKVKSSLNKMNSISESVNSALVKHSVRNVKFESICAMCNRCLFDANHDICIIDYVNDVNVRLKSKSKRNKMRKVWKPTGKVLSEIGYSWKATGSSSKSNIVESKTSNTKEPTQSGGSTVSDVPSSSLINCRSSLRSSNTKVSEGSLVLWLCSWPMRVQSINGRKYILVIVDDFSWFTWVKFLRSKDEVPEFVIKFLKMSQFRLNATIRNSGTDNGTEFINQTLRDYYEEVGISHQTSVARTPQQNGIVKRWNCTLVEVARTMLIFSKALLFLWTEAVATACYTQNRSLI
ncbi:retrovirus-related pol polyprotein from transposon TNT 1-94 [Tanacetum coccineum]